MSDYTKLTDFAAKDALASGNPSKIVLGSELDAEFEAIEAAIATKSDGSGAITTGDKGDITVSAAGATWTIDAGAVTLAKMADMATSKLLGRSTAGTGAPEALSIGSGLSLAAGTLSASGGGDLSYLGTFQQSGTVTSMTETEIAGYDVAAAALTASGQCIVVEGWVAIFNADAGGPYNETIRVYVGATGTVKVADVTFSIATGINYRVRIWLRLAYKNSSTATVQCVMMAIPAEYSGGAMNAAAIVGGGNDDAEDATVTWASTHIIKVTAQSGGIGGLADANLGAYGTDLYIYKTGAGDAQT